MRKFLSVLLLLVSAAANSTPNANITIFVIGCGETAEVYSYAGVFIPAADVTGPNAYDSAKTRAQIYEDGTMKASTGVELWLLTPEEDNFHASEATFLTPCNAEYCNDKMGSTAKSFTQVIRNFVVHWQRRTNIEVNMDCQVNELCGGGGGNPF